MKTRNTIVRVGIIAMALLCCMETSAQSNRSRRNRSSRSVPARRTPQRTPQKTSQLKPDSLVEQRQILEMEQFLDTSVERQPTRRIEAARTDTWIVPREEPAPPAPKDVENKIFDVVETSPSFPGGPDACQEWLRRNIHYPPVAEENNIQGRVVVSFVVEPDGSLSNIAVVKGVDPSLDKEAVRVVSAMPKWNPGKQNNVCVRVKYNLPVPFKLN